MTPTTYIRAGELTSPTFGVAFAEGCGGTVATPEHGLRPGDFAAFCSPYVWPLLRQAQAEGRNWYYGDHGYFGRGRYFRVTRNGYQHDGRGDAGPGRFVSHGRPVRRWRRAGAHVLLCPNSDTYFRLFGTTVEAWLSRVRHALHPHTDRLLITRQKTCPRSISYDLQTAWAVVTFSSAAAMDALIAGVPVFVLAPFAAAYRMGTDDLSRIETPVYPDDREPFVWNLAAQQWTLDEIARGDAWKVLRAA